MSSVFLNPWRCRHKLSTHCPLTTGSGQRRRTRHRPADMDISGPADETFSGSESRLARRRLVLDADALAGFDGRLRLLVKYVSRPDETDRPEHRPGFMGHPLRPGASVCFWLFMLHEAVGVGVWAGGMARRRDSPKSCSFAVRVSQLLCF